VDLTDWGLGSPFDPTEKKYGRIAVMAIARDSQSTLSL
jgi:hypothetical protein